MNHSSISYQVPPLLIGGEEVREARDLKPVHDPATGEVLGQLAMASTEDLDRALEAAHRSFKAWRAMAPSRRGDILRRGAHLLRERALSIATHITLEQGKPLLEAKAEINMAAATLDWFAEEGRRAYGRTIPGVHDGVRYTVLREPVGPIASFAPWNFPVTNAARKIGSALAAGCTCIHKPAEEAPASAYSVGRALMDAGLPKGVLSIVFGDPDRISRYLISSDVIRKISFTGSVSVGRHLMQLAALHGARTTMELGGHAPVLVFADADLDKVLESAVVRKFANAGQVCVSPTRFYVHQSVHKRFAQGFAERASALKLGHGLEPGTQMGPLAHERRPSFVRDLVQDAVLHGARMLSGAEHLPQKGSFFPPTTLSHVPESARIMNEEPFGPVAIINSFQDIEEAIDRANRLPFGLAAYAFTQSLSTATLLSEALECGMVGVNTFRISLPDTPFGGIKDSGHGLENGIEGLDACMTTKLVAQA